jgi:hypothetical protein
MKKRSLKVWIINLTITHRAELELKMEKLKEVYRAFLLSYNQYMIEVYKIFWSGSNKEISVFISKAKTRDGILFGKQD